MESNSEKTQVKEITSKEQALKALLAGDPRLTNLLVVILILCQTGLV